MKLIPCPRLWFNPNRPFFHQRDDSVHAVLIFLITVDHVLQLIPYELRQGGIPFLAYNSGHVEEAFVKGKGKISFHINLRLLTYYV